MKARRISSRQVVLTATFLALAAGGTAACDDPTDEEWESSDASYVSEGGTSDYDESDDSGFVDSTEPEDGTEVFYCADENGEIVEEELCAKPNPSIPYFLWHSTYYARDMTPGMILDGGDHFAPNDRASRRAFKLPATGQVRNGTIKTNVVGKGSTGSTLSSGTSGG